MRNCNELKIIAALTVGLLSGNTYATNGYFLPGYGIKASGMGGVSIALAADAVALATNPAAAAYTGLRGDIGVTWFRPPRSSGVADLPLSQGGTSLNGGFGFGGNDSSGNNDYLIPDMAFTLPLSERTSFGFAVVGAGLGTTYKNNFFASPNFFDTVPYAPGDGSCSDILIRAGAKASGCTPGSHVGVDLIQLQVPITLAYRLTDTQTFGASLNLAAQRFKANGLGQFILFGLSGNPAYVTNNGYDYSYGAGVRLGWQGHFLDDRVVLGAVYTSRTYMTKFDRYKGLFAEQGDFDIPENYGLGFALKVSKTLTIAGDVVRILYSDVASVGNDGPGNGLGGSAKQSDVVSRLLPTLASGNAVNFGPTALGADGGYGFGWKNMTVYKLGVAYDASDKLVLRAGYNYSKNPIDKNQAVFSALAPATTERHYSVGFTYKLNTELPIELSGQFTHVPTKSISVCGQAVVDCVSYKLGQTEVGFGLGILY